MPANASERRYATAAFTVAGRTGDYDMWLDTLGELARVLQMPSARTVLLSPAVPPAQKAAALERILPNAARGTLKDGWVWDEYQMAIHLAKIGRMKSWLVVRRSGELPDWVSADQVWDFRDDSRYKELLAEAFPQQFVNVIGVRPDGSTRVAGPIERVRLNEVGRQLEASEKFDHFLIEHL